ncbi:MAG: glycosyltransferase family 2 protein [Phascolarctobacterium sp.]|nr:glycosyltransferase family 2 protein [Phascolarctobacterium sp.]
MLTIVILTKNEEENIVAAIQNANKVSDKILIVDSGSTDKTVELAKANGAKVVYRAWDNDFAAQRNFALEHIDTEWVLYLDADEHIDDQLATNIKKELQASEKEMYRFIRRNSAFGREFKYGVLGPDSVVRMFPTDLVKWEGKVHESPVGNLPVKTLQGFIQHYTYKDFSQYLSKMNSYAAIGAQNNKAKNKKVSVIKDFVFRPFFAFIKMYILKLGFLEGWLGFVLCLNYANYTLNKYIFLKMLNEEK